MLPTHGRAPLRRFLLGSVTAKVLHDLTVPVWTGHPLRIPYTSILAAIDTSDEAEAVIRAAAALAASYQASYRWPTFSKCRPSAWRPRSETTATIS